MQKIILCLTILCASALNAQERSYGIIAGANYYDITVDGSIFADSALSLNLGGYIEYQLNERFGARGSLMYSNIKEDSYSTSQGMMFARSELHALQLHALIKYDVRKSYNKGFYFIGGLRATTILSSQTDGENLDGFYRTVVLGAMVGIGVNFGKHFGLELIPEQNLTSTLAYNGHKTKNTGIYANVTIDLQSLLEKQIDK